MNYGINYGEGFTIVSAIRKCQTKAYYELTSEHGTTRLKKECIDFSYFMDSSFNDYLKALKVLSLNREEAKQKITKEQFEEAISLLGKEEIFEALSCYTIVDKDYRIVGYSSKNRKDLCSFFHANKGKMDIIVLDETGIPVAIVPPTISDGAMIVLEDVLPENPFNLNDLKNNKN
jgi:hypothetical protein